MKIDRTAAAKKAWETIRARKAGLIPAAPSKTKAEKADEQIERLRGLLSAWMAEPEPEPAAVAAPMAPTKKRRARKAA